MRMIPIGKLLALLDHVLREINGIDPPCDIDHSPGDIAGASPDIKDGTRFIGEKAGENSKNLIRIRGPMPVRVNDPPIFERVRVKGAIILRFGLHLCSFSKASIMLVSVN